MPAIIDDQPQKIGPKLSLYLQSRSASILDVAGRLDATVQTLTAVSEWVSSFLTAHKHNLGHLVPLQVKNQEKKVTS